MQQPRQPSEPVRWKRQEHRGNAPRKEKAHRRDRHDLHVDAPRQPPCGDDSEREQHGVRRENQLRGRKRPQAVSDGGTFRASFSFLTNAVPAQFAAQGQRQDDRNGDTQRRAKGGGELVRPVEHIQAAEQPVAECNGAARSQHPCRAADQWSNPGESHGIPAKKCGKSGPGRCPRISGISRGFLSEGLPAMQDQSVKSVIAGLFVQLAFVALRRYTMPVSTRTNPADSSRRTTATLVSFALASTSVTSSSLRRLQTSSTRVCP